MAEEKFKATVRMGMIQCTHRSVTTPEPTEDNGETPEPVIEEHPIWIRTQAICAVVPAPPSEEGGEERTWISIGGMGYTVVEPCAEVLKKMEESFAFEAEGCAEIPADDCDREE